MTLLVKYMIEEVTPDTMLQPQNAIWGCAIRLFWFNSLQ